MLAFLLWLQVCDCRLFSVWPTSWGGLRPARGRRAVARVGQCTKRGHEFIAVQVRTATPAINVERLLADLPTRVARSLERLEETLPQDALQLICGDIRRDCWRRRNQDGLPSRVRDPAGGNFLPRSRVPACAGRAPVLRTETRFGTSRLSRNVD